MGNKASHEKDETGQSSDATTEQEETSKKRTFSSTRSVLSSELKPCGEEPTHFPSSFGRRRRVALLIGNSTYAGEIPALKNPCNDATSLGAKLARDCAFVVDIKQNLETRQAMEEAVDAFHDRLTAAGATAEGAAGFFFYAGHAVQIENQNYLLPTKMPPIRKRTDVKYHALPLEFVLERLEMAANNLNIVVLDCCREDPFSDKETRGVAKKGGLAPVTDARGTFIAYSCSPNSFARDSPDLMNSVYCTHLIRHIGQPNMTIDGVFTRVSEGVLRDTQNCQVPWRLSSMTEEIKFVDVQECPTQAPQMMTFDDSSAQGEFWGMLESLTPKYPNVYLESGPGEDVQIGRMEGCIVRIPDSACISRIHCRIFRSDTAVAQLEDLSSNGTWVNGELVGKNNTVLLEPGDEIMVQKSNPKAKSGKIAFRYFNRDAVYEAHTAEPDSKRRRVHSPSPCRNGKQSPTLSSLKQDSSGPLVPFSLDGGTGSSPISSSSRVVLHGIVPLCLNQNDSS